MLTVDIGTEESYAHCRHRRAMLTVDIGTEESYAHCRYRNRGEQCLL